MKLFSLWMLSILFGLVAVANLEAAELLYDVNFNADSVGLRPLSGTGIETPTLIISGGGTVSVAYTEGDLTDKPIILLDTSSNSLCRIAFKIQPPKTSGTIKLSWDGLVSGSIQKGKGPTVSAWNQSNSKSPFILEYIESGKISFAGITNLSANYTQGIHNHFDLWINLDDQLVKFYVDDVIIIYSHIFIHDPGNRLDNVYMIYFDTGISNATNQKHVLDNIHIEWDTEMSSESANWKQIKILH